MIRPVRFSSEYATFDGGLTDSFKSVIESYAYAGEFAGFLSHIHESNRDNPAYADIIPLRVVIDRFHDTRNRVGDAFMDGSALALDSINRFMPTLTPFLHDEVTAIRDDLFAHHTVGAKTDDKALVTDIHSTGHDVLRVYVNDYKQILSSINEYRGYTHKEQVLALIHGFSFVMTAASRAQEAELAVFESQVIDEIVDDEETLVNEIRQAMSRKRGRHAK